MLNLNDFDEVRKLQEAKIVNTEIEVSAAPGYPCWRLVYARQFTKAEMERLGVGGQSNCFVALLDFDGVWIPGPVANAMGLSIGHSYENAGSTFKAPFEKKFPDAPGNIPVFAGTKHRVWVEDSKGLKSDIAYNILYVNVRDSDVNTHHSSLVVFRRSEGQVKPGLQPGELTSELQQLLACINQAESFLESARTSYNRLLQILAKGE